MFLLLSYAIHIPSRQVRRNQVCRECLSQSNLNTTATGTFLSLRIFRYYIDMHMMFKREKYTPMHAYISRVENVGAEFYVCGKL